MRSYVVATILANRREGLDETGLHYLNYARNRTGLPQLLLGKRPTDYEEEIDIEELELILRALSDDELLFVYTQQCCQRFR